MHTVLVIDDDPDFRNAVEHMLAGAGYDVLTAADGRTAVDLLEKNHDRIDLSIVDLGLPDINGFELIGAISRRATGAKVLAVTGIYKDLHLEMSQTVGADAAIRKPPAGKPLPEREWLETVGQLIGNGTREKRAHAGQGHGKEPSNAAHENQ